MSTKMTTREDDIDTDLQKYKIWNQYIYKNV